MLLCFGATKHILNHLNSISIALLLNVNYLLIIEILYPGVAPQSFIRIKFGSCKSLNETEACTVH